MDSAVIVREYEQLSRRLGIEIRYTVSGPSGLCTIKGKRVLFIEKGLGMVSRADLFTHAFRDIDLSGMFVVPVIRRLLNKDDSSFDE